MAGAPNLVKIGTVLDRAAQMRTGGGKGPVLAFSDAEQEPGAVAEAKDLRAIQFQISDLGSYYFVATQVCHRRRDQIAEHRVHERDERSEQTAAQE
jgi:hypothetical protein